MTDDYNDEEIESDEESSGESEMETEGNGSEEQSSMVRRTYIPTAVNTDEELDFDESAYLLYRKAQTEYPCLSFDIVEDRLGSGAERADNYPLSTTIVAGTQSGKADGNKVLVLRMSNVHQIKHKADNESDDSDSDSDDEDNEPQLDCIPVEHRGCVNRIRNISVDGKCLCGTWSESGTVYLWDFTQAVDAVADSERLNDFIKNKSSVKPIFSFNGHRIEGYGLDWSSLRPGLLATGDCRKNIFIWKPSEGSTWAVDQKALVGHKESVEDLQWSPSEENVLGSCSVDQSIRIWDIRAKQLDVIIESSS
ncbi:unnamed protein product [Medioppia subpectinata]|uniref:Histone-binding protein RBBP4-like N-terminal domain-containing protein n=1 Tax=Medioppia subpectinata TaxID=1979941 RepID=A0A7R9KSK5_9ACAR|nr:unnamed protein product [Medioppia subpectinata]CAG2108638.1 unnamed protein product [Medioppia subpectinata]